jgi:GT2 family glycosyltransferase
MSHALTVSIAIPTYNREQVLIETIECALLQDYQPLEILVVDQTDVHDEKVQLQLDEWGANGVIKYIRHSPAGLPGARNRALRESSADILIFIDDDVTFGADFASSHLKNFVDDSSIAAVAGRVVQRLGYPDVVRPIDWPRVLDYQYFRMDSTTRTENIANFQGGNHSVRVSYALALGGYDEGYRGVALREETDCALRIFLNGGRIVYDPSASLFHIAAPSGGCRRNGGFDVSAGISYFRFYWKFKGVLRQNLAKELWKSARLSLLTKGMLKKPHLLPIAGAIYIGRILSVMLRVRATENRC